MPYLLVIQGPKEKYLQCKFCNSESFVNISNVNQKLVGSNSIYVKADCAECGENSIWRFMSGKVEERSSKPDSSKHTSPIYCDQCGAVAKFIPPTRKENGELIVKFGCKNNHITIRKFILK